MSIELINRVCELSSEVGKAQVLFEQKDAYIKQCEEHIAKQGEEAEKGQQNIDRLTQQVRMLQSREQAEGLKPRTIDAD
jgi:hypothetical protein